MSLLASDVMARSGLLLNDPSQVKYTNTVLLPPLQMAYDELLEHCEDNQIPVTNSISPAITVAVGVVVIDFTTTPALPSDLIAVQKVSERLYGTTNDYLPLTQREFLPETYVLTNELTWYSWIKNQLKFVGANTIRQILIEYIGTTMAVPVNANSAIDIVQCKNFLAARTAAIAAEFIGNNPSRAESLNATAQTALDRFLGIALKSKQSIATRRRPFRAGFKRRGIS